MSLTVCCPRPNCGKLLRLEDAAAGRRVRCPHCQQRFQLAPAPAATQSLPPARSAPDTPPRPAVTPPAAATATLPPATPVEGIRARGGVGDHDEAANREPPTASYGPLTDDRARAPVGAGGALPERVGRFEVR